MAEFNPELESIVRELNEQASPDPGQAQGQTTGGAQAASRPLPVETDVTVDSDSLDPLLRQAVERGASDVLLVAGCNAVLRVNGSLIRGSGPALDHDDINKLVLPMLSAGRREELETRRSCDFSFVREGIGRFRTNVHFQRGTLAAAVRLLPPEIPTLESLNLPASLAKLTERKQGLILVTGPTGSGKTSTLAALMGIVNENYPYHVVTIEDPIEYYHVNRKSIFEQIEVGHDCRDFAGALRSILRQNPDVILVGEMRDPRNRRHRTHRRRDRPLGPLDPAHERRGAGAGPHRGSVPQRPADADPAAALAWALGDHRAATRPRRGRAGAPPGGRDLTGEHSRAPLDPQG